MSGDCVGTVGELEINLVVICFKSSMFAIYDLKSYTLLIQATS